MHEATTIIHAYTRADALSDGNLIDVSADAKEAGIKFPVALTRAVWLDCVEWTDADAERTGAYQDQSGRLWDVVWMTRCAIARASGIAANVPLYRVPRGRRGQQARPVTLVAVVGPGDDGEPVITVMTVAEWEQD